jgi:hypothetical protein
MKWKILAMAGCLAFSVWLAGAAETRQERGKRAVDEALQALGGDAFLHMQDRVESGRAYSFYRQELTGLSLAKIYTHYLPPKPGEMSQQERENFGKDEAFGVLFTEKGAWDITFRGARPLDDQRYDNYKDSVLHNILYIIRQRLQETGLTFYAQDTDFWENRPVQVVDITDAQNRTVTVYFDRMSKLPVRQIFKRRNPEFKDFDTEETVFANFRDVGGGARWPYSLVRKRNGEKIFEMYSNSVEINQDLNDSVFALPADIKMLPKAK